MWSARREEIADGRIIKIAVDFDSQPVSYGEVLRRWQTDAGFRSFFNELLAAATFNAFRWENPPLTATTMNRPMEFVVLDSPGIDRTPDVEAFAEHVEKEPASPAIEFANLRNDATLIVPCPQVPPTAYGHLGAFVRQAPESQKHALWALVGATMQRRISGKPIWLSTAGAGVSWLHVRLDDRPKYYGYIPYRRIDG